MLTLYLLYTPCFVCMLFFILYVIKSNKSYNDVITVMLSFCSMIYFFAEAQYISVYEDYETYIVADTLSQFARPLTPPLSLILNMNLIGRKPNMWYVVISIGCAVIFGTVSSTIFAILGPDEAIQFINSRDHVHGMPEQFSERIHYIYQAVCIYGYQIFFVIQVIAGITYTVWICRKTKFKFHEITDFFFKGSELEPAHILVWLFSAFYLLSIIKLLIGREAFMQHQMFAVCFVTLRTCMVFMIGHIISLSYRPTLSINCFRNLTCFNEPIEEVESYSISKEENELSDNVTSIIKEQKLYLDPEISIDIISHKVGSNRTYVSAAVNRTLGMSFRDYINSLRISYAKEYMKEHPEAVQDEIATASGFSDASVFNRKFKAYTGTSPRLWLLSQFS